MSTIQLNDHDFQRLVYLFFFLFKNIFVFSFFLDISYKIYQSNDYGHSMLWVPKLILGIILMWPNKKYRLWSTLSFIILTSTSIISTAGILFYLHANIHDFDKVSNAICLMMLPIFVRIKRKIRKLINQKFVFLCIFHLKCVVTSTYLTSG